MRRSALRHPDGKCVKPEMTSAALAELLRSVEGAGIEVWLDGGWGIDALVGEQTRPHKDVDAVLGVAAVPALRDL
jgi:lincosamide nucleotidyltransferase A/C/D/E